MHLSVRKVTPTPKECRTFRDCIHALDMDVPEHLQWMEEFAKFSTQYECARSIFEAVGYCTARLMDHARSIPTATERTNLNDGISVMNTMTYSIHKMNVYTHVTIPVRASAATFVQKFWRGHFARRNMANPAHPLCQKRLLREFQTMGGESSKRQK